MKKLVNVFVLRMSVEMKTEFKIVIVRLLVSTHIRNVRLVFTNLVGNFEFQKYLYILYLEPDVC